MKNVKLFFFVVIATSLTAAVFSNCSSTKGSAKKSSTSLNRNARKLLLRDEGMSQLSYIDLANANNDWYVKVPAGRDMQLSGNGRVLIGTDMGYEEHEIATGKKVSELTSFKGTIGARRLRNGNTLLTELNWQDKKGIVLLEVDQNGTVVHTINFPNFSYVRLVRETASGTFMITANTVVFEGDAQGNILWQAKIAGPENTHAWQALRLANGNTLVSCGFAANFQLFGKDGQTISTISGPADVKPHFYAGYQILENGNYVVTNWQGHGPTFGASGTQVLEYTPGGELVWSWKQYADKFSSLQGVIVLDGLDQKKLYIEDDNGKLKPVR